MSIALLTCLFGFVMYSFCLFGFLSRFLSLVIFCLYKFLVSLICCVLACMLFRLPPFVSACICLSVSRQLLNVNLCLLAVLSSVSTFVSQSAGQAVYQSR